MAIREVPRSYVYTCDGCGEEHTQENANGHYSNSRPSYWSKLKIEKDAYDYQGAPVADGSVELLLCNKCTSAIIESINTTFKKST
jgi:hypothetical protein